MLKRIERPDCSNNEKLRKGGVLLKKPRGSLIERSSPHYENLDRFEFSVNLSSKGKRERKLNHTTFINVIGFGFRQFLVLLVREKVVRVYYLVRGTEP